MQYTESSVCQGVSAPVQIKSCSNTETGCKLSQLGAVKSAETSVSSEMAVTVAVCVLVYQHFLCVNTNVHV